MSRTKLLSLGLVVASVAITAPAQAGNYDGAYTVELNKTEIVRLSEPASAVIVGNPQIADVSVHSSDTVFVVGRGYGQTNLIVMNANGQTIMNADIQVTGSSAPGNVRLYSGNGRQTYNCAPYCQPSPILGDSVNFISQNTPDAPSIQNSSISGRSTPSQNIVGSAQETGANNVEYRPTRPDFLDD